MYQLKAWLWQKKLEAAACRLRKRQQTLWHRTLAPGQALPGGLPDVPPDPRVVQRTTESIIHPRSAEYGRVRRKQILITSQTQKLPGSSLPLTVPLSKEKFEEQLRFKLSKAAPANPLGSKKP